MFGLRTSMPPCLGVGCGTNFWGYPQCPSGTQQQFRPVPASSSTACCQDVPSGSANCQIVPQGGTLWCVQGQACNTNSNQCVWVEEVGYECQAYGDISNVCGLTVGYIQTSGSCPTGQMSPPAVCRFDGLDDARGSPVHAWSRRRVFLT